jgi:hypothetical protein
MRKAKLAKCAHSTVSAAQAAAIRHGTLLALADLRKRTERLRMHTSIIPLALAASWLAFGCAASFPVPTQDQAQAVAAERSAVELGAANQPNAQLHLQLAREQMVLASAAIKDGDNGRADALFLRARSDAELAIALTRDQSAKTEAVKATEQSNAQRMTNVNQGAAQ